MENEVEKDERNLERWATWLDLDILTGYKGKRQCLTTNKHTYMENCKYGC